MYRDDLCHFKYFRYFPGKGLFVLKLNSSNTKFIEEDPNSTNINYEGILGDLNEYNITNIYNNKEANDIREYNNSNNYQKFQNHNNSIYKRYEHSDIKNWVCMRQEGNVKEAGIYNTKSINEFYNR